VIWIRARDREDIPWLLEQLRAFSAFYGTTIPLFPDDPASAASILEAQLSGVNPFFVAVVRGDRAGFISGALMTHPYNAKLRSCRSSSGGSIRNVRGSSGRRAAAPGVRGPRPRAPADWILMTLEAKSPIEPRSLERRGYRLHESTYLLEVA
jgi:hypothetical protein